MFKQWYGGRRFTVAVVAIVTILFVTLCVAIYSFINAVTTISNLSFATTQTLITPAVSPENQTTSLDPTTNQIESSTSASTNEVNMKTTITTGDEPSVTVNGTPITLPDNGTVQQKITTDEGTANVNVQVHTNSSGTFTSHSSMKLRINASTNIKNDGG